MFHPTHIGGDFGGKGGFMDVPVAYFLSKKSGQPVRMIMDYTEELTAGNPRHAAIIKIKTGVKKDGKIVAHHLDFLFDSGAYASMKPAGYLIGASTCAGPYKIENCLIEERMVYTNKIPCGHMRAPGDPQGFFANESQLDMVARKLGMDPAEFKRKNMLRDGDETPTGGHISHIRGEEALQKALELSDYSKPKPKNVGRGLSFSEWSPSGGEGNVFVTIEDNGKVKVITPVVDQGAGVLTVIVQVVGEELGVPADEIELKQADSTIVPSDGGVGGSRATRVYGNASFEAGIKAREELFAFAAQALEVEPKELTLDRGAVAHKPSKRKMSFSRDRQVQRRADLRARLLQKLRKIPRCLGVGANRRSPCRSGDRQNHLTQHGLGAHDRKGDQSADASGANRGRRRVWSGLCADRRSYVRRAENYHHQLWRI